MVQSRKKVWLNKEKAIVNGKELLIDSSNPNVKPIIINPGRTMIPLRFVAENFGCTVN